MDIIQYSTVLAAGSLLLAAATFLSVVGFFFSPRLREKLNRITYTTWMTLIGGLSAASVIGTLIYQFTYLTPVCSLCWWQRIFMFPLTLIAAIALYTRSRTDHLITGSMAALGLLFASYHYYGHFQKYVIGNPFLLPCSTSALEPSCSESPIILFGFMTIPLFGVIAFSAIIWLSYLAHRKSQTIETV
ncbi:MAG: disulfide bond formation protein B [Candidatus Moraniibacteriota bacterium]